MTQYRLYNTSTGKYLASDGFTSPAWWTVHESAGRRFTAAQIENICKHWSYARGLERVEVETDEDY